MPRCSHTYEDSSQCRRIVSAEQKYCYSHDPLRAGERKRKRHCCSTKGERRRRSGAAYAGQRIAIHRCSKVSAPPQPDEARRSDP